MWRPRNARFLGEVAFLVVVAAIAAVLHFGAAEIALAMTGAFVVVVVTEVASVREDSGAPRRARRKVPPRAAEPEDVALPSRVSRPAARVRTAPAVAADAWLPKPAAERQPRRVPSAIRPAAQPVAQAQPVTQAPPRPSPAPVRRPAEAQPPLSPKPKPEPRPPVVRAPAPEPKREPPPPPVVQAPPPEPRPEPPPPPVQPLPPQPKPEPPPVVSAPPQPSWRPEPTRWNLFELQSRARSVAGRDPARDEEWSFLLLYMREYADSAGLLPLDFDSFVRESFPELVGGGRR